LEKSIPGLQAIFLLALIIVNLLVYLPAVKGEFIWDDKDLVLNNSLLQNPKFLKSFLFQPYFKSSLADNSHDTDSSQTQFYRPISMLSLWLDFKLWGFNSKGFHITNICLHLMCVMLFYMLLLKLKAQNLLAIFSAFLFSIFPFHFENVAWISGRTDILSFLLALVASLLFLSYLKNRKPLPLTVSAVFYLISLLAKENCIFVILIFFLFCLNKRKSLKHSIISISPHLTVLLGWLLVRSFVVTPMSIQISFKTAKNIMATIGFYTFKSVVPLNLSISINSQNVFSSLIFPLLGLTIILMAAFFIINSLWKGTFTENSLYLTVIAFFLLLLPSLIVLVMETSSSLLAWRFMYAPSAVFLGIMTYLLWKLPKSKKIFITLMVGISLIYVSEILPKNAYFGQKERDFWLNMEDLKRESIIVQYNASSIQLWYNEAQGLANYHHIMENSKDHPLYQHYRLMILENCAAYYTKKREFTKAKYYFDQIKNQSQVSGVESIFNYANYLYLTGEKSNAQATVEDLLKRYPTRHDVLFMAAKFFIYIKEEKRALKLLQKDYSLHHMQESRHLMNQLENKISGNHE
jgi:tetratricopeptide (TPR) repeat protein